MEKKKSYVLISVLIIMMVLVTMTYFFSDTLFSELSISRNQKAATIAFNLAEAGVSEAVWRIQYDASTRDTFLNTTNGQTNFSHNPALVSGGSYDVNITNTAEAVATITAIGHFQFGSKTAQRQVVVNVTKANTPPPYDYDGAIFTGGATGEEDITITNTTLNIDGSELQDHDNDPLTPDEMVPIASLISNRDIWFTHSTVDVADDILAKRDIRNVSSDVTYGGDLQENITGTYTMPSVDVTSENATSYKSLAQAQNQYYTASAFDAMLETGPITLTGVVYVAGSQGININDSQSLTVNGMLVSEGSIDVGKSNRIGILTINHVAGDPSGLIALSKLTIQAGGIVTINGLIYIGDRFSFDPYLSTNLATKTITIEGGILSRRFSGNGPRIVNINLNKDWINDALQPTNVTPVIQTQHWEEEY